MKVIKLILFNRLALSWLLNDFGGSKNMMPNRVKAFFAEIGYVYIVILPFVALIILSVITAQQTFELKEIKQMKVLDMTLIFSPLFGVFVMALFKDVYNGQSIVNRQWGFKVIDVKTGEVPTRSKCLLRNITAILWPIELPFLFFNQERRLGDYIAGTKLVSVEKTDPQSILSYIFASKKKE